MGFFRWNDRFRTGIQPIDQQHMSFLEYLNDCHDRVSGGQPAQIDRHLIDTLKKYAATHFRFEERLMRDIGYPGLERQKRQHRYFEARIAELEKVHNQGGDASAETVLALLRDWFMNHIIEEDKEFVPYV